MKLTLQKQGDVLLPYDEESLRYVQNIPENRLVIANVKRSRNPQFHRRAFVMMTRLHEMSDEDAAFDPWRKWLLIQAGYCTHTGFANGSVRVEADSMTYEAMDQDKFATCWRDIHQAFVNVYGNKLTYDQLTEWSVM